MLPAFSVSEELCNLFADGRRQLEAVAAETHGAVEARYFGMAANYGMPVGGYVIKSAVPFQDECRLHAPEHV